MFHITDYISKMDTTTHEMLSLMLKAIAQNPKQNEINNQENAKTLLHTKMTLMSHNTVPMLSSLLLGHIHIIHDCKNSESLYIKKVMMPTLKMKYYCDDKLGGLQRFEKCKVRCRIFPCHKRSTKIIVCEAIGNFM